MEKERKKLLLTGGLAFVGGIAVTLTAFAIAFCPAKRYGHWRGAWHDRAPYMMHMDRPMPPHHDARFDDRRPMPPHHDARFDDRRPMPPHHDARFDDRRPMPPHHDARFDDRRPMPPHHDARFDDRRPEPRPHALKDLRRPGKDGFHPNEMLKERFAKKLNLTDEQKEQIEKFRKEDMEQMKPLFEQMDELRKKADELRQQNKARFESVLTAEQIDILKSMHDKKMARKARLKEMKNKAPVVQDRTEPSVDEK